MEDIESFQKLLNEFEKLPKFKYEPSYLDICHYPGTRFEEICSRILAFYFQPKNEHGLGTLFIECLFEAIEYDYKSINLDIEIKLEAFGEGKRLDLLLKNRDWVIGIENKISAKVNNPLDKYKKLIDECGKKNNFNILLTLHDIIDKRELEKIQTNNFIIVLYSKFFDILKNKIDQCISDKNTKYIVFLYDFIQALEHKKGGIIMSKELDAFFQNNLAVIKDLTDKYETFKLQKYERTVDKVKELLPIIKEKTEDSKWDIFDSILYLKNDHDIGIESWFKEDNLNCFIIQITFWQGKEWSKYEVQLKEMYPNSEDYTDNKRHCLIVYKITRQNDEDQIESNIIEELFNCYNKLKNLKE
jgi:hypothetical protein